MSRLAVVIPAYKEKFFEQAIRSLANQTVKDFTVYIGDDCSPFDLYSVVSKYEHALNIKYTRFADNIGAENLVQQWTRCVDLTEGEAWIWLFSDDDLVDANCVEKFYRQLELNGRKYDVYRFNNTVIDENNDVKWITPESPSWENSEEMAYNLLLGKRGNSMADHIFSRTVYLESGGFVVTKYAQGADWATSILFAKEKGIVTIANAKFYWRYSDQNISSTAHQIKSKTLFGYLQFTRWITEHFLYLKTSGGEVSYEMMIEAARVNLISVITQHYKGFGTKTGCQIAMLMHSKLHMHYIDILKRMLQIKSITNPVLRLMASQLAAVKNYLAISQRNKYKEY